ncbi:hypothetical protein [Burkholderia ambifaria]|uniref:hypothetical protein n=1 Tax=Burkholderia ambifaria TaxID=152480 RepID=UPI000F7FBBE9|nr:hypothetical protein [Burkholderia ambifaria]
MCKQECKVARELKAAAEREMSVAVNAMSLLFGMHAQTGDTGTLVTMVQEQSGAGFVDGLIELAPLAVKVAEVELALSAACDEDFPGVFQHEVTEELGRALVDAMDERASDLLATGMQRLGGLAYSFMRDVACDPDELASYAQVIGQVLPGWTVPVAKTKGASA